MQPEGGPPRDSTNTRSPSTRSCSFNSHPAADAPLVANTYGQATAVSVPEPDTSNPSPEPIRMAAQGPRGLHVDFIEMKKPFLHNQPALSLLVSNPHNIRRLPSQLVYPSGKVSVGFFPSSWPASEGGNDGDSPSDDDETRLTRLQYGKVVAYASEFEGSDDGPERLSSRAKHLALLLFCFAAFQIFWIGVILAGGELYPFNQAGDNNGKELIPESLTLHSESNTRETVLASTSHEYEVEENNIARLRKIEDDNGLQRFIYCSLMAVHLLAVGGILFKLPIVVSLYNALQFASGTLIAIFCLYSVLDLVVLVTLIPVRFLGGRILDNMTPHVFTLKTT